MTHPLFRHINTNHIINIDYKINIVACHITDTPTPFIRFLFEKEIPNELTFPSFQGPSNNLREDCLVPFPEFNEISYIGYVIFNKEVYAFVRIADSFTSSKGLLSNKRWWCLVDEILNYRKLLDCFTINKKCVDFLFSNVDYYTLYNGVGTGLQIPYIAYLTSDNVKQTEIDHYFGPIKEEYDHYVFESCDDLLEKEGCIRYAVFETTPITVDKKPRWFVRKLENAIPLSWHLLKLK